MGACEGGAGFGEGCREVGEMRKEEVAEEGGGVVDGLAGMGRMG